MSSILDTNIISEMRKPNCDANVRTWLASVRSADLYLSVLVIGEIRQGVERLRRRDRPQATVYETWLGSLIREYNGRIIPVTRDIAEEWGRMNVPDPISPVDGLMAATARVRGWTFVTRNTRHLVRAGVRLLNPFEPQS